MRCLLRRRPSADGSRMKKSRRVPTQPRPPPPYKPVNAALRSRMPKRKPSKPEPAPSNRKERRAAAAKARKQDK